MSKSLPGTRETVAFICIYKFSVTSFAQSQLVSVFFPQTFNDVADSTSCSSSWRDLSKTCLWCAHQCINAWMWPKLHKAARSRALPLTGQPAVRKCRAPLLRIQTSEILDEALETDFAGLYDACCIPWQSVDLGCL